MFILKIPEAPSSIKKGFVLKSLIGKTAIEQLAANITHVHPNFNSKDFIKAGLKDIEPLTLTERSKHIATTLHEHLPETYSEAIAILIKTLTPPLSETQDNGLAPMFYMPHCNFIAMYGVDAKYNNSKDPFDISMDAQYHFTKRFTCEFSIRSFIINDEARTMKTLNNWMTDPNPHLRRLASEGTRPRLPWAMKIDSFVKDPTPALGILEALKNDPDLYVRRSVANHIGDIAKDHLDLAMDICERWLVDADKDLKWVIRHAVRNPFKKGNERAIALRKAAK